MRGRTTMLAACCVAALTACASGSHTFTARPGEHFHVTRRTDTTGTLGDLASAVTTNTLLAHRGAKLLEAQPFPACPGEAGEQTFSLKTPQGPAVLRVAFTQWNGKTTIASYQRPARSPDDPKADEALRRNVCSTPL